MRSLQIGLPLEEASKAAATMDGGSIATAFGEQQASHNRSPCYFARQIYANPQRSGLRMVQIDNRERLDRDAVAALKIEEAIVAACEDASCHAVSFIFPRVRTLHHVSESIRLFRDSLGAHVERYRHIEHLKMHGFVDGVSIRLSLPTFNVESWALAFGSFWFFPPSRQTKHYEIALRVKPREAEVPKQLAAARPYEAHLADIPWHYNNPGNFSQLWNLTERKKKKLLELPGDRRSKARNTLTIPSGLIY
jgi:hypothetical protein